MKNLSEFLNESIQLNALKPYPSSKYDSLYITKVGDETRDKFVIDTLDSSNGVYEIWGTSQDYEQFQGWKLYIKNGKPIGMSALYDNAVTQPIVGDPTVFAIKVENDIYIIGSTLDKVIEKAKDKKFYKELE